MTAQVFNIVEPRKVGIWVRVSTEFQSQGDSPVHHEERAREYAKAKNWTVAEIYRLEAVSGKSILWHSETKRMMQDIKSGKISCLIISKFARLVRKTRELLEISDFFCTHKAELVSLDEPINISTSSGRLFLSVVAALAEWEREEIASRVSSSIPIRAKLGKPLGGSAPYGFQWLDKKLVHSSQEVIVYKLLFKFFLETKRKKTTARMLNDAGYRTRNGSKFSDTTIDRLLRNPTANGSHRANYTKSKGFKKHWFLKPQSEWIFSEVEPIVAHDIWEEANNILNAQHGKFLKSSRRVVQIFGGIIFCKCGQKMYKPGSLNKYVCIKCRSKIVVTELEKIFLNCVSDVFSNGNTNGLLSRARSELVQKHQLLDSLNKDQSRTRNEMDKCYRAYIAGDLDLRDFSRFYHPLKEQFQTIEAQIAALELDVQALESRSPNNSKNRVHVKNIFDQLWPSISIEKQRNIVESLVKTVIVYDDSIDIIFQYLNSIVPEIDIEPLALLCGLKVSVSRCNRQIIGEIEDTKVLGSIA